MAQPVRIFYGDPEESITRIAVIAVGGCGGNILSGFDREMLPDVDLIAINTDAQALQTVQATEKFVIGQSNSGAGANPVRGRAAAEHDTEILKDIIKGKDLIFLVSGFGKGTGTGVTPYLAQLAREMNESNTDEKTKEILTIAFVITPFEWEGDECRQIAKDGLAELRENVNALMVLSNQKVMENIDDDITIDAATNKADKMLSNAIKGIYDVIKKTGKMNLDFEDVKSVTKYPGKGRSLIGNGSSADPDKRGVKAAQAALNCSLADKYKENSASHVLVNVTGSKNMKAKDVDDVMKTIREWASPHVRILPGITYDDNCGDEIHVSIIATGFDEDESFYIFNSNGGATDCKNFKNFQDILVNAKMKQIGEEQQNNDELRNKFPVDQSDEIEEQEPHKHGYTNAYENAQFASRRPGVEKKYHQNAHPENNNHEGNGGNNGKPKGKYVGTIDDAPDNFDEARYGLPIFNQQKGMSTN